MICATVPVMVTDDGAGVGHHGAAGAGGDASACPRSPPASRSSTTEPASASLIDRPLFLRLSDTCSVFAVARRRDGRHRRVVDGRDVDGRRRRRHEDAAGAGVAVVVDRQRQRRASPTACRCCRRSVTVLRGVGVQQRVDLRHGAGDGHRRRCRSWSPTAPLVPAVTVSVPSVTDSVTVIELEPASASLIDEAVVLEVERHLLGVRVAGRRDGRHRRVVDRRDVDGRRSPSTRGCRRCRCCRCR